MAYYTSNEVVDILLSLGESRQNYRQAAALYCQKFPNRRYPTGQQIRRIELRKRRVARKRVRRRRTADNDHNVPRVQRVLTAVGLNPHIYTRQIERLTGLPHKTVWRILKRHRFYPYHISFTQQLSENDMVLRIQFCEWALKKIRLNPNSFYFVMFTDEAMFHHNGQLNRHNSHYWSPINPHWTRMVDNQHRWILHVWCGIINGYLIGPYFFEDNLNSIRYLAFLQNELPGLLEEVDIDSRQRMWWQQDGAPPHSAGIVTVYLNQVYHEKWIGRFSPTKWPPRPPDFYLWGYLKNVVCKEAPTTREDMKNRIKRACNNILRRVLLSTVTNFQKQLRSCLQQNGSVFENLLNG